MKKNHNRPLGAIVAVLLLAGNLPLKVCLSLFAVTQSPAVLGVLGVLGGSPHAPGFC
ncbi:MAG TPA: hypothetical protein VM238_04855 [Phycisphaerae bacterium]|nr:hypothetical protein [Phycisphaerae bacterium]